jgi:integration host factor subunit alpha|tara:strand:+ start:311 stop:592 length:282 start_codon:yes stop_codon:yes gene_type:complete
MVKVDIVRAIQLETGLQFGEAEQLVNELLEIMKQTLENGEDVLITGLGKFQLRQKTSRPGRDPKNKQDYTISARQVVTFRPSKVWRDEINGKV